MTSHRRTSQLKKSYSQISKLRTDTPLISQTTQNLRSFTESVSVSLSQFYYREPCVYGFVFSLLCGGCHSSAINHSSFASNQWLEKSGLKSESRQTWIGWVQNLDLFPPYQTDTATFMKNATSCGKSVRPISPNSKRLDFGVPSISKIIICRHAELNRNGEPSGTKAIFSNVSEESTKPRYYYEKWDLNLQRDIRAAEPCIFNVVNFENWWYCRRIK